MNLRDDLNAMTPRLRRYARALLSGHAGGCERADDLVHATLMRALNARNVALHADLVVRLYATLTQLHRDIAAPSTGTASSGGARGAAQASRVRHGSPYAYSAVRQNRLTVGLMSLPLEEREALLLVALEGFSHDEAARILHVTRSMLLDRLARARHSLDGRPHLVAGTSDQVPERERSASHLRLVK